MTPLFVAQRVLLVDDEAFVLKLLARQLQNLGYQQLDSCDSGLAALERLEATTTAAAPPFDLIFCDLQMPGMDGIELVRNLALRGYAGGLVLVSGEPGRTLQTAERLAQAHGLNLLGALRKPVDPGLLREVLTRHIAAPQRATERAAPAYSADELRQALAQRQFVNHYQPKVELASRQLVGAEVLVRWDHPQHGLVGPDRFIGAAEEHGLIDELLKTVLVSAFEDGRAWQQAGLVLTLAVNASMDNLSWLGLPDFVAEQAAAQQFPLTRLVLEVTESRLMTNPLAAIDTLTRLRLKRIALSIDDFGTGHSSLTQLRDLPFDELKVDRSFVHGAAADPALRSILESSLTMARQLGMSTVGEGVEDLADWGVLRQAGCDLAQGYFIAKPMPAADLAPWAAAWPQRSATLLRA